MNKIIRQILILATLCWIVAGCSKETLTQEYGEGTGYLYLTLGSVDVELSATTRAEADPLPENLIPSVDDFTIDIRMGDTSVKGFPKPYSELTTKGIELPAGGYTVTAYHGENAPLQDTPYFAGSSAVQIYPGQPTETTISAALANAMLVPDVTQSLQNHYTDWTLTVKAGEASMPLAAKDNTGGYLFAQAGQAVNAVFEGANVLGNESSHEWTVVPSAVARTRYVIQCDPDLSIFSNIQLTATATHTYAESILTGTDVILNLAANGAPLELVDQWDIQLLYNGTAIRTYTAQPENNTLMTVTEGWPYVPQSSTLSASIHLRTGETIELTSAVLEAIPLPEFTTTVSGSTSYSVYQSSGADAANAKDGSSIFDINATATIAPEISGNSNYSNILKVTYTTDSGQNSGEQAFGTVSQFSALSWQKHALSATVSFDGVERTSSPIDCHVTGLPYILKHPANNYGWYTIEGSNIKYNNDCIFLEAAVSESMVGSPPFHIQNTIDFSLSCQYEKNNRSFFSSHTFSVETLNPTDNSRHEEVCSHSGKETGRYDLSGNGSFTSEINAISCRYSYRALGNSVDVYTMQINYRDKM